MSYYMPEDEELILKEIDHCVLCHELSKNCKCIPEAVAEYISKMKTKHKEH